MSPMKEYFKVVVTFERRADGGLRAYSDDVPGFVLSHSDQAAVLDDVKPALEKILSHMFDGQVMIAIFAARIRDPEGEELKWASDKAKELGLG